MRWVREW